MRRIVSKIVTSAALFGAFLLLPSTSRAGGAEFGVVNLGGTANGGVSCDSKDGCQYPDPMFGDADQPAIEFDLGSDQTVHLEADLYDGTGCQAFIQTLVGDLDLLAGHDIVFIRFNPPLDPGTQLSIVWRVDDCPEKACQDYTIGEDPATCFLGN